MMFPDYHASTTRGQRALRAFWGAKLAPEERASRWWRSWMPPARAASWGSLRARSPPQSRPQRAHAREGWPMPSTLWCRTFLLTETPTSRRGAAVSPGPEKTGTSQHRPHCAAGPPARSTPPGEARQTLDHPSTVARPASPSTGTTRGPESGVAPLPRRGDARAMNSIAASRGWVEAKWPSLPLPHEGRPRPGGGLNRPLPHEDGRRSRPRRPHPRRHARRGLSVRAHHRPAAEHAHGVP